MLYSKLGSIPKTDTDGTEGWIEVSDPPTAGDGQEVVWWFPPGWVVRPVKPAATDTTDWSWSQSTEQWVEYANNDTIQVDTTNTDTVQVGTTGA